MVSKCQSLGKGFSPPATFPFSSVSTSRKGPACSQLLTHSSGWPWCWLCPFCPQICLPPSPPVSAQGSPGRTTLMDNLGRSQGEMERGRGQQIGSCPAREGESEYQPGLGCSQRSWLLPAMQPHPSGLQHPPLSSAFRALLLSAPALPLRLPCTLTLQIVPGNCPAWRVLFAGIHTDSYGSPPAPQPSCSLPWPLA